MNYYVFGSLSPKDDKHQICLAGPFATQDEALKAVEANKWDNWIINRSKFFLEVGQLVEIPPPKNL